MSEPLLKVTALSKSYTSASKTIEVLKELNLAVEKRMMIAIMGASGVGKSTLLHILGGLDSPDSGEVLFEGKNLFRFSPIEISDFRNKKIGYVFQFHHLLPEFNTLENTMMPFLLKKYDLSAAESRARALLAEVGLTERLDHRPGQLSGGEQQRVAIARALMQEPALVLADEPTGNLDERTSNSIFQIFRDLHQRRDVAFIVATHNPQLASICDQRYVLHNGALQPM